MSGSSDKSIDILTTLRLRSSVEDCQSYGKLWKACFAELTGTFILCFIGFCTVQSTSDLLTIAFSFGLAGALGIWLSAPISGGNINPAVSLGLLVARQISLIRFIGYVIFQILGSLFASSLCTLVTSNTTKSVVNSPVVSSYQSVIFEIIVTFILVFTVMRMCVEKCRTESEKGVGAFAIGLSIFVGILAGANISSSSMNPARSIGPAIVEKSTAGLWIFILGPLIGGALAGFLQQVIFTSELSGSFIHSYVLKGNFEREEPKREKLPEEQPLQELV